MFQFEKFAGQLVNLISDDNLPTPYSIAIHGEWGSGKTSLIGQMFTLLKKNCDEKNIKIIWFNAWEYEQMNPMLALMQTIESEYESSASKLKEALKGLLLVSTDIFLRTQVGVSIDDVKEQYQSSIKHIPSIREELEGIISSGRLIVFIDDLDRCSVDNALNILEAVKLFFNSRGAIFVFAVDIKKLEKAWELRYGGLAELHEGKEHIDKIFQLKLSLPPKERKEIEEYVNQLSTSLPQEIRNLVVDGCPHNPRKIKRILNLLYFLAKETTDKVFEDYLPILTIWSIATIAFPDLAYIIKKSSSSLVEISLIVNHLKNYESLLGRIEEIKLKVSHNEFVDISGVRFSRKDILPSTIEGLEQISKDIESFNFIKAIADYYSIWVENEQTENLRPTLEIFHERVSKLMLEIIFRAGLIG